MRRKIQMNRVGRFFCSTEWIVYENDMPLGAAYHVECQNVNLSFDTDVLENVHEEIKILLERIENDFGVLGEMCKMTERKREWKCEVCGLEFRVAEREIGCQVDVFDKRYPIATCPNCGEITENDKSNHE